MRTRRAECLALPGYEAKIALVDAEERWFGGGERMMEVGVTVSERVQTTAEGAALRCGGLAFLSCTSFLHLVCTTEHFG